MLFPMMGSYTPSGLIGWLMLILPLLRSAMAKPTRCDCLNVCGDDPWLDDGRSMPCDGLLRVRAAATERCRVRGVVCSLSAAAQANGQVVVSAEDMAAIQKLVSGG